MTATLVPPSVDDDVDRAPVSDPARGQRRPRRWWTRLLRLIVGFAVVLVVGNLLILAAHGYVRSKGSGGAVEVPAEVAAIRNFAAVDGTLWRGGAPSEADYRALAAAGVTTVVDLRAEDGLRIPDALLADVGITRLSIPIRDGQTPTTEQVARFLDAVDASEGSVYLHCGAGVGRTGTMAAAYSVSRGGDGADAMRANLAVGPPSLEQLAFAASLDSGEAPQRPNAAVVAVSRTLDAPRRIWKAFEGL